MQSRPQWLADSAPRAQQIGAAITLRDRALLLPRTSSRLEGEKSSFAERCKRERADLIAPPAGDWPAVPDAVTQQQAVLVQAARAADLRPDEVITRNKFPGDLPK